MLNDTIELGRVNYDTENPEYTVVSKNMSHNSTISPVVEYTFSLKSVALMFWMYFWHETSQVYAKKALKKVRQRGACKRVNS